MVVASLYGTSPCLPDLDSTILRACHHPFSFAVERYACDIPRMALEHQQRGGVGRSDVEEFDIVVARGGEESLIGGDA